jgi:uncharacterized membrane protein YdjX (TVP38/TMEM64 family)
MAVYALLAAIVLGVNLLPAFGPPTWAVLVWFEVTHDLDPVALVLVGATAATLGRVALATGAGAFRGRLSAQRREGLDAAKAALAGSRRRTVAGLGLFLVSPLPSAQLFVAAGLLAVPLRPLAAAFLAGRLVSYSIYVTAGKAASDSFGDTFESAFRSPLGIVLQIVTLVALVALVRLDWTKIIARRTTDAGRRGGLA